MPIDLNPFGLYWVLDPSTMSTPIPASYETATAEINGANISFYDRAGKEFINFNLIKKLGEGGYGTTFLIDEKFGGKQAVVKMIRRSPTFSTQDVIAEVIAQIIISEGTKDVDYSDIDLKGPFAAPVFHFAKDANYYYILNQRLMVDLNEVLMQKKEMSHNIKVSILQIATILDYVRHHYEFNHRDFKPDNIMFDDNGVRLIDFGFCCMKYEGLVISPGYEYPKRHLLACGKKSRDLNALFYYLLNRSPYLKIVCPIKRVLRALMFASEGDPVNWKNSYEKYNSRDDLPNMSPEVVIRVLMKVSFLKVETCPEIAPVWVRELVEINEGVLSLLKKEEINELDPLKLVTYLRQKRSQATCGRLLGITNNDDVKEACQTILANP